MVAIWLQGIGVLEKVIFAILILILLIIVLGVVIRHLKEKYAFFFIIVPACLLTAFFGLIASQVFFGIPANSVIIGKTGDPAHILSLAEVIFGFFSLLLAIVSILGVSLGWWLNRRTNDAIDAANKAKDAMESLKIANYNFILSANMALMHLPSFTYTQQIPLDFLGSLQILNNIFEEQDKQGHLWKALSDSNDGARISYARALFLLGTTNRSRIGEFVPGHMSSFDDKSGRPLTILELLYEANRRASGRSASSLHRDVLVRLFQAWRQKESYEEAEKILNNLRTILEDGCTNDRVLADWGQCVLYLQWGENTLNLNERQKRFLAAAMVADKVYEKIEVKKAKPGKDIFLKVNTSIYYYLAKAYWSLRFTMPNKLEESDLPSDLSLNHKMITDWWGRFNNLFKKADEVLEKEYDRVQMDDEFTAAIYKATRAYLSIAARNWTDNMIKEKPPGKQHIRNLIQSAEYHLDEGDRRARNFLGYNSQIKIYCDLRERFEMVENFKKYLGFLRHWVNNDGSIYNYYQDERWHSREVLT